jgi:hypothetical protein
VFPFATLTGAPVKAPYHARAFALSWISTLLIDHADPDPFVHDVPPDTAGSVTPDPADDAVDDVVIV